MAFTDTVVERFVQGNKRIVIGNYANDGGSTGGDIVTGLQRVDSIQITPKGSSVQTNAPVVNETLPLAGGDVTIVTDANTAGTFRAEGV